jgi:hypothetical protein
MGGSAIDDYYNDHLDEGDVYGVGLERYEVRERSTV